MEVEDAEKEKKIGLAEALCINNMKGKKWRKKIFFQLLGLMQSWLVAVFYTSSEGQLLCSCFVFY